MDGQRNERKHIFVINGSPTFLNLMRDLLQDEGYSVTTTNYVPRSFHQIAAAQPDALVLDLESGRTLGWDLLERLHADASTAGIPVLLVSGDRGLLELAQAQVARFGGNAYLGKPFNLDDMLQAIATLLEPGQAVAGAMPDGAAERPDPVAG